MKQIEIDENKFRAFMNVLIEISQGPQEAYGLCVLALKELNENSELTGSNSSLSLDEYIEEIRLAMNSAKSESEPLQ